MMRQTESSGCDRRKSYNGRGCCSDALQGQGSAHGQKVRSVSATTIGRGAMQQDCSKD